MNPIIPPMSDPLPSAGTRLGDAARRRLSDEVVVWLTTVGGDGTPQPNPVWFIWDGETVLTYNRADAVRVAHVRRRPRVSLNFDGNGRGGEILVITGDAEIAQDVPSSDAHAAYAAKYAEWIPRLGMDAAGFAAAYPVAIRIRPTRVR
jgi:PPOX class probable F420-dependent enzyme